MYVHRSGHALFPLITPRAQNHLLSYIISRKSSSRCAIFTFLPWILPPRKHPPSTANDRNFVNISSITIQNDTKTTITDTHAYVSLTLGRTSIKIGIGEGKCPALETGWEWEGEVGSLGEVVNRNLCACGEHNRGEQWYRKWNIRDATILAQIRMKQSKITRYGRPRYATVYISPLYRGEE